MIESFSPFVARGSGIFSGIISWFIRVVIYDICVTTIQDVFGVSRMVALFIFLGITLAIAFGGYVLRQKSSGYADD
jgi:hypothetical protein